uniref:PIN domain-containing protein n=1 Tax=Anopheles quadriannulatus TaxID=34691 RepID=A0A182XBC4_ANOQN
MDCMEFDYSPEPKRAQNKSASDSKPSTNEQPKKAEKQKETNNDSQKAMSDLKTKYKEGLSAFSSYFYCVIDTNIFIEHYQDFQSFLSKKYKGSQPIVIIPYKVLHELDTVKHKKPQLASKIVPVVKFLHKMLRAKDARVKGQHPWDDTIELMPVLSPDDSIVNCALQVQTVAGDAQVVLVSNDCNMLTKALVANLNSFDNQAHPLSQIAILVPYVTTSALDTKQTKVANEAKTGRIATIPSKLPNTASVSRKADKTLSTIVKAKNKKANGLPVAWRAELYGTRPGSAQARLEQLCTALNQEVEEQKKAKTPKKAEKQKETNNDSQKAMSDLKTKYKEGLSAFPSYFYCVIDTNIFIEHYQDFQSFLSKKYKGRQPIVIIPYKVLHELDTVKHKKPQLASKIVPVVKFLHKMLRAKDARVKGQHPWDDTIELMPLLSPDDSIVNCALQVQTVAGDAQVVLVSNDCNMLTKALVANLNSCTMEELQSDYNF